MELDYAQLSLELLRDCLPNPASRFVEEHGSFPFLSSIWLFFLTFIASFFFFFFFFTVVLDAVRLASATPSCLVGLLVTPTFLL